MLTCKLTLFYCLSSVILEGFLLQLLQIFPTVLKQTPPELISRESQTETEEGQLIEQQEEEERESIERRMLAFQKDCEARHRETLEQEVGVSICCHGGMMLHPLSN